MKCDAGLASEPPFVLMIAGPNGSGKTTLTNQLRADGVDLGHYVNPDEIAKTLEGAYGARVREAQQIAADERQACLEAGRSFSFETVMSHPSKIEVLREAKTRGFRTALYFVATESPSLNVARVAQRVLLGGHDVPEDRIRQRYVRTLDLLPQALEQADLADLFDNTHGAPALLRPFCEKAGARITLSPPLPDWARPVLRGLVPF